jgi:hypothetical protein
MKFSKVGIFIILLGISLLAACSEVPKTFSGESDNWSIHYETTEKGEKYKKGKCDKDDRYLKYIGNKPTPKSVEYSLLNESGMSPIGKKGMVYFSKGCINSFPDTQIEIKWDGKSETIPLTEK